MKGKGALPALLALSLFVLAIGHAGAAQGSHEVSRSTRPLAAQSGPPGSNRVIFYYQTEFDRQTGTYISLAPIWTNRNPVTQQPYATDVIIAAFHLGYDSTTGIPCVRLNRDSPDDPKYDVMWSETSTLQDLGVRVHLMLGGAARGSYRTLFSDWETFYPLLAHTLATHQFDGIDLDVEESVALGDIQRLIDRLQADFGDRFLMTLAPVASALWGGRNLSGFSYPDLFQSPEGEAIAWFNAQFYSGFASVSSTHDYDRIMQFGDGLYPPGVVVVGMLGNPRNGSGFVPIATATHTISTLRTTYPGFGGAFDWEYYNTLAGDDTSDPDPASWAEIMAASGIVDEAESLTVADYTPGDVERVFIDPDASNGAGVILEGMAAGDSLTLVVPIPEARAYALRIGIKNSTDRGIWQLSSNGIDMGSPIDQYASTSTFKEIDIGEVAFDSAGNAPFTFTIVDRNASSAGFWIALDYIELIPR